MNWFRTIETRYAKGYYLRITDEVIAIQSRGWLSDYVFNDGPEINPFPHEYSFCRFDCRLDERSDKEHVFDMLRRSDFGKHVGQLRFTDFRRDLQHGAEEILKSTLGIVRRSESHFVIGAASVELFLEKTHEWQLYMKSVKAEDKKEVPCVYRKVVVPNTVYGHPLHIEPLCPAGLAYLLAMPGDIDIGTEGIPDYAAVGLYRHGDARTAILQTPPSAFRFSLC